MSTSKIQVHRYRHCGFKSVQGEVKPHYILRHTHPWMKRGVEHVVFETFSKEADMKVEIVVHWTQFTQWMKKMWPHGGQVKAVLLDGGQRMYAQALHASYREEQAYLKAPLLCRDVFSVVTMDKSAVFLEVEGVRQWLNSSGSEKALEDFNAVHEPYDRPKWEER